MFRSHLLFSMRKLNVIWYVIICWSSDWTKSLRFNESFPQKIDSVHDDSFGSPITDHDDERSFFQIRDSFTVTWSLMILQSLRDVNTDKMSLRRNNTGGCCVRVVWHVIRVSILLASMIDTIWINLKFKKCGEKTRRMMLCVIAPTLETYTKYDKDTKLFQDGI